MQFTLSKKVVDLSLKLLEEISILDFTSLSPDEKAFLLSQLKKTTGELGNFILKNDRK